MFILLGGIYSTSLKYIHCALGLYLRGCKDLANMLYFSPLRFAISVKVHLHIFQPFTGTILR